MYVKTYTKITKLNSKRKSVLHSTTTVGRVQAKNRAVYYMQDFSNAKEDN